MHDFAFCQASLPNKNCSTIQDEVVQSTTASSNITENAIILYNPSTVTVKSLSRRKSVVIKEDHQMKTLSTLLHNWTIPVKRNLCNCIKVIIKWIKEHYPDHAKDVVFNMSTKEVNNSNKYYWKNTKDLHYDKLYHNVIKAFLLCHNTYVNNTTKHYTFLQMRKYWDALLYRAE